MPQPPHQQPESSGSGSGVGKYNGGHHDTNAMVAASGGLSMVATSQQQTNKGGKGIRNRVFCGECTGCLKNDDCGKCRYCKDKTKFGGQNRLRQKCLHRRCQLDTHRRRSQNNNNNNSQNNSHNNSNHHHNTSSNSHNNHSNNHSFTDGSNTIARQSPSPDAIYSGVALARLASQQHQSLVIDTAAVQAAASVAAAAAAAAADAGAKKQNGGSQLS